LIDLEEGQHDVGSQLESPSLCVETVPDLGLVAILDFAIGNIDTPVRRFFCAGVHFSDYLLGLQTGVLG